MKHLAKFNIGERVYHIRHGYHAIVVDVDPYFRASKRHNPQALKSAFAHRNPWYRLLVEGRCLETYVEEPRLIRDEYQNALEHPQQAGDEGYSVQTTHH